VKKYVWGLDIAGSQTITGSVGALLAQIDGTGTAYSVCDANGNVSEYLDEDGDIQGHFEYSPFGKATVENGARPDDFAFRFSTKYEDTLTGDLYYGYRDYDSKLGRWRSRDPLGEAGSRNLYGAFINSPISNLDYLGKFSIGNIVSLIVNLKNQVSRCVSLIANGGEVNPDPPHPLYECPKIEGAYRHCWNNCEITKCTKLLGSYQTIGILGLSIFDIAIELVGWKEDSLNDLYANLQGIIAGGAGEDCANTCVKVSDDQSKIYCCQNPHGLNKDNPKCCDGK
jgi:RHS repeat-associated protein